MVLCGRSVQTEEGLERLMLSVGEGALKGRCLAAVALNHKHGFSFGRRSKRKEWDSSWLAGTQRESDLLSSLSRVLLLLYY